MKNVHTVGDFEELARRRLPTSLYHYIASGSGRGQAVAMNLKAFDRWCLAPKVLVDVSHRSQAIDLFGKKFAAPIGVAPMGIVSLCSYDGDRRLAKAAAAAGVPYVLSGASTTRLEDVLKVNASAWFQAYLSSKWEATEPLLRRVWAAGCQTLVVTVDVPVAATRAMELRAGFSVPLRPSRKLALGGMARPRWLAGTLARTLLLKGMPHFENLRAERAGPLFSTALDHRASRAEFSWPQLQQVRDAWKGQLVVKGLLRPSDAILAASLGVNGIVVSNHGGRQLDGAVAPMAVLRDMVKTVPGIGVMVDGGFRSGTDVIKALALGAKCVFVGRPVLCGLAARGERGAHHALELMKRELDTDLALIGCPSIKELDESFIVEQ